MDIQAERILTGMTLMIYGGLNAIDPKSMFLLKAKLNNKIFGVSYKASNKTYKVLKIMGIAIFILGLMLFVSPSF